MRLAGMNIGVESRSFGMNPWWGVEKWLHSFKSYGVCYGVISIADTWLLAMRQAAYKGQELYLGLVMELGNLHGNAKGNAQWNQSRGKIPKWHAGADWLVVVMIPKAFGSNGNGAKGSANLLLFFANFSKDELIFTAWIRRAVWWETITPIAIDGSVSSDNYRNGVKFPLPTRLHAR